MYRPVFQFMRTKKVALTRRMVGRLILLAVYGEEHEDDDVYPIDKELTFEHFAKRKLPNLLKLPELVVCAISISLDHILGVEEDSLSWKWIPYGLKIVTVDLLLETLRSFSAPVNSIVRPLKNLYLESRWKFLLAISLYCVGAAVCFLSGGLTLALGGGLFTMTGVNNLLGITVSTGTVSALATASDIAIMTGLTSQAVALLGTNDDPPTLDVFSRPPRNNISRLLFNSNKAADTFPLAKMNNRYAGLSFIGADPVCPRDRFHVLRHSVADGAKLANGVAGTVVNSATMVRNAAMTTAAGASGLSAMVPPPFNTALDSVAVAAGVAGATAAALGQTAQVVQNVTVQVELTVRPGH